MYVSGFAGGALNWLGTEGGTREYQNPQATEAVAVTASSEHDHCSPPRYAAPRLVQHRPDGGHNLTGNKPNSWLAVALGGGAKIDVAHYCLRHGISNAGICRLRHWDLEGSLDGLAWTTLRSHRDDQSLPDAGYSTAAWAVEGGKGAFSHFRIRQTGKNSRGDDFLCCAGIDLYGVLQPPQKAEEERVAAAARKKAEEERVAAAAAKKAEEERVAAAARKKLGQ
jgi:hypothetical protein